MTIQKRLVPTAILAFTLGVLALAGHFALSPKVRAVDPSMIDPNAETRDAIGWSLFAAGVGGILVGEVSLIWSLRRRSIRRSPGAALGSLWEPLPWENMPPLQDPSLFGGDLRPQFGEADRSCERGGA